jgi:A/G-specific adenine glycosylase
MISANAANRLMAHYIANARSLPWRAPPRSGNPDPYRVWLSEVMLQQTTVAAVIPRFERFVHRWPTIEALATAPEEEILSEWAGLGYYARARNLIACARTVAARGTFPDSERELRQLPGIGDYTAAAIAAIAFGQRAAVVDTNVTRVIARVCGLTAPTPSDVRALVAAATPAVSPGDFAQAMMDLGATVCRPKAPLCGECPLRPDCVAARSGRPEQFPAARRKSPKPQRFGTAFWIERQGCVWLVRRPPSGLLGGMAALPGSDWTESESDCTAPLATIRHVFTHFALTLAVVAEAEPVNDGWWQPLNSLATAGLPTLYKRAVEQVLVTRGDRQAA